ncbi:unnamed protein product [Nyctereutes procyonoides]|uniref:nucleoside-diphosphate kinase n=1 Tax=Nyctereutes procyonoides TaxID=34880 RepID=A0A811YWZ4_NYCPR|nr:unnamed protein product [Nyctereutes procyonoides]
MFCQIKIKLDCRGLCCLCSFCAQPAACQLRAMVSFLRHTALLSLLVSLSSTVLSWTWEQTLVVHFERRGFKLVGMKMLLAPERVLAKHFDDLQREPFYPALISYMSFTPCTIGWGERDFNIHISRKIIHTSDSVERAQRETQLWFQSRSWWTRQMMAARVSHPSSHPGSLSSVNKYLSPHP